jgi:hypothetical protein
MFMGCLENYPQKGFKAGVLKALVISRNDLDPSLLMRFKSVFKEENKDRKKERKREGRKGRGGEERKGERQCRMVKVQPDFGITVHGWPVHSLGDFI